MQSPLQKWIARRTLIKQHLESLDTACDGLYFDKLSSSHRSSWSFPSSQPFLTANRRKHWDEFRRGRSIGRRRRGSTWGSTSARERDPNPQSFAVQFLGASTVNLGYRAEVHAVERDFRDLCLVPGCERRREGRDDQVARTHRRRWRWFMLSFE